MSLDDRFFIMPPLDQYFVDKDTGLPLAEGTLTFYRDSSRTTPKPVYALTGYPTYSYTALTDPITLSGVGTILDDGGNSVLLYMFPYQGTPDVSDGSIDLYYIVCKDSGGTEQWTRQAVPNLTIANNPSNSAIPVDNQISNPQFSRTFINSNGATTYNVTSATSQKFSFAPDWDFYISGTGSVIVQQIAVSGNAHVLTSPPFVLDVSVSSGITACYMTQRMSANSGLWATIDSLNEPIFLNTSMVAINMSAGTAGIEMYYNESTGSGAIKIMDAVAQFAAYTTLTGASADPIPLSTNTDSGVSGYIDLYVSFLPNTHVRVSSIQVVPSYGPANITMYDVQSSNREQAFMGDYYLPRLEKKAIPSMLTGWDFPLNPAQDGDNQTIPLQASAAYMWDQLICGSFTNTAMLTRNAISSGLNIVTGAATDSFYMLQYLSGAQAKKIIGTSLSVNVNAYTTSAASTIKMNVYLYRGTSVANFPTLPTTIGTIDASGVFSLTGGNNWLEIPRSGLPTASANLTYAATNSSINSGVDYGFNGWQVVDSNQIGDTDKFAIVITFNASAAASTIIVNSVGLVPGDIPTRPAPQTFEDVLRECEYYYEKSKENGVALTTADANSAQLRNMTTLATIASSQTINSITSPFAITYSNIKRVAVTPRFYTTAGVADNVTAYIIGSSDGTGVSASGDKAISSTLTTSFWAATDSGTKSITYYPNAYSGIANGVLLTVVGDGRYCKSYIKFHYSANARLGVVT